MKERSLFSDAFVLLEALFSLMLSAIALSFFAFYLSLPKHPIQDQQFSSPVEILSTEQINLRSSFVAFKAKRVRFKAGKNIYTSFEPFQ